MENIKNEIKVLAGQQKGLKNQAKTVHIIGERTMEPWKAQMLHQSNRCKLRELYFAYALLRGKNENEIEINSKSPINMNSVNKLVEQYGKTIHSNS